MKKRPVLLATLAVILIGAAGATSVFLVGSKQRRDDRQDYLAYERSIVVVVREVRDVVAAMRSRLAVTGGPSRLSPALLDTWNHDLATARSAVAALTPPAFLRQIEGRWLAAIDAFARVPSLIAQASVRAAREALDDADSRLGDAARVMQFHRRRLGLGPTPQLPDPAASVAG